MFDIKINKIFGINSWSLYCASGKIVPIIWSFLAQVVFFPIPKHSFPLLKLVDSSHFDIFSCNELNQTFSSNGFSIGFQRNRRNKNSIVLQPIKTMFGFTTPLTTPVYLKTY